MQEIGEGTEKQGRRESSQQNNHHFKSLFFFQFALEGVWQVESECQYSCSTEAEKRFLLCCYLTIVSCLVFLKDFFKLLKKRAMTNFVDDKTVEIRVIHYRLVCKQSHLFTLPDTFFVSIKSRLQRDDDDEGNQSK